MVFMVLLRARAKIRAQKCVVAFHGSHSRMVFRSTGASANFAIAQPSAAQSIPHPLMTPIGKAKADSRIKPLLDEASEYCKIKYEETTGPCWTCEIREDEAFIRYCETKYSASCLAHELLHVIVQKRGFRQVKLSFSTQIPKLSDLVDCLNNELQHHKMFPLFTGARFKSEQFYNDEDVSTAAYIEEGLKDQQLTDVDAVTLYFTIIAPGGHLTQQQRDDYEKSLKAVLDGRFKNCVEEIKTAVADWTSTPSYDSKETIIRICHAIANPSVAWFSFSAEETTTTGGFFTDTTFEVVDPGEDVDPNLPTA